MSSKEPCEPTLSEIIKEATVVHAKSLSEARDLLQEALFDFVIFTNETLKEPTIIENIELIKLQKSVCELKKTVSRLNREILKIKNKSK